MFGSSAPQSNSRRCHIAVVVLEEAVPHLSVKVLHLLSGNGDKGLF